MVISSTRRQLQGPRPTPLIVSKNSCSKMKIPFLPPNRQAACQGKPVPSPVIIYLKSPDIIHVRPEEFMGLVQRLTGKQQHATTTRISHSSSSSYSSSYSSAASTSATMADNAVNVDGWGKKNDGFSMIEQELDSPVDLAQCCLTIYAREDWNEF